MNPGVPLFRRLLSGAFDGLPAVLRCVHDGCERKEWAGRCTVERGSSFFVKILAPMASLPPSGMDVPLRVTIETVGQAEIWTRDFDGHRMRSHLWAHGALLAERLGPITLFFALSVEQGRIEWRIAGARYLGVALPAKWFAGANASESVVDGRYRFAVRATLPLVADLVRYNGWLAER